MTFAYLLATQVCSTHFRDQSGSIRAREGLKAPEPPKWNGNPSYGFGKKLLQEYSVSKNEYIFFLNAPNKI